MLKYMSATPAPPPPRKRDTGSNSHAEQKKQGAQKHTQALLFSDISPSVTFAEEVLGVVRVNPEFNRAQMFHDKSVPVDLLLGGLYNQDVAFIFCGILLKFQ